LMLDMEAAVTTGLINDDPERVMDLFKKSQADVDAHHEQVNQLRKLHPCTTYIILARNSYAAAQTLPMIIEPEKYPTAASVEPDNVFRTATLKLWGVCKYSD
jgi:hypothetical protein